MYTEGQTIPEENIESYFVWIPKYKYKLWNIGDTPGEPREIEIVFTTVDTKDATSGECTTPMLSEATGNCKVGDYMTHPSFISMGTNGLWVGKFETGYKGATVTTEAEVNSSESGKIQIKPNVYSWRKIQLANAYLASYNYNRDLDSHMMKNTEWGSVAYLTNSKYGRCENGVCAEIRINNNSNYITGFVATTENGSGAAVAPKTDSESSVNYSNTNSQVASTTGNYTGIYDMSGGAWEPTMGIMKDSTNTALMSGYTMSANSGFNGPLGSGSPITNGLDYPDLKYVDVYNYSTDYKTYQRRILGDATGETGPFNAYKSSWYNDYVGLVMSVGSWFDRSGPCDYQGPAGGVLRLREVS